MYRKYHNVKCEYNGIKFDSKFERDTYIKLSLLEKANEISELKTQEEYIIFPKSKWGRKISYVADFTYIDKNGKKHIVDTKSKITMTRLYRLKKRCLQELYGLDIEEVMR